MTKIDILNKLKELEKIIDIDQVIILSGASLVLHDIIEETEDIDLACTKEYYDQLNWHEKTGAYGINIKEYSCFEIGYNLYFPNDVDIIDEYKCLNLKKCLEIKNMLNRDKDKTVIQILENMIKD